MQPKFCWRCQMEVPMLTDEELKLCQFARSQPKAFLEEEIRKRKIEHYEWLGDLPGSYNQVRNFIEMYRIITGFPETNPNAIFHHVFRSHLKNIFRHLSAAFTAILRWIFRTDDLWI